MLAIGDVHLYVSDFDAALRFWAKGLQLEVAEQDTDEHSAYARLDFPDGGPSLLLIAPAEAEPLEELDALESHCGVSFDVIATEFDAALVRLLENGGQQIGETETYNDLRNATLADPDGNLFELLEVPPESA